MKIPPEQLDPNTLEALVKEWLMREGEDWALVSRSLADATVEATEALKKGKLVLVWDAQSDSFNIVSIDDYNEE